jgi:8-oxo-dGTP diphosphatase
MTHDVALAEARLAVREFDDASAWYGAGPLATPFGADVWVYDEDLVRVLLVNHPWRGWVPPGGKVEPGETPREGAVRELFEETGLRVTPLPRPAAVAVRSYGPGLPPTLGFSYTAIGDSAAALNPEPGQPAAWTPLASDWATYFPEDADRIRWHATWLGRQ